MRLAVYGNNVPRWRMSGKRGKNDAADAAAIGEAVSRLNLRFVAIKPQAFNMPA